LFFLILGSISLSIVSLVYFLYYVLIYGAKDRASRYLKNIQRTLETEVRLLPSVSIIVSTYEEAKVIRRKIENIADSDYPLDKMEIIVIDDASKDRTAEIAERALAELGLNGKVLRNPNRIGLNASLNTAIEAASNDVLCITDSDVTFKEDALQNAIKVLVGIQGAGGVTGKIVPSFDRDTKVTRLEDGYRDFSNRSMLAESFRHSTFPGSGVLTAFRRSSLTGLIPVSYGSTDGNISMSIVKSGHRFLYVPYADVYEPMPADISQHRLQKVRRAKRLIQVVLHNTDVLFNGKYGEFGLVVFPLKFAMLVLCPVLMCIGFVSFVVFILLSQSIVLYSFLLLGLLTVAVISAISGRLCSLVSGFVLHQFYLIVGLFSSFKKGGFWKKIERR